MSGRSRLQLDFLAVPKAVPELRRAVAEYLGEDGAGACADVQLCVTELVANVIRHVGEAAPVRVRVSSSGGRTRIEVTDPASDALPSLRHADTDDESGRGLSLLDAVAWRWGVDRGGPGEGKTVWCEVGGAEAAAIRE